MKGDGSLIKEYSVVALQGLTLVLFIFFMWVASTRYEIAENRRFCGRDCDVCYVAPVCGDGGNRACDY